MLNKGKIMYKYKVQVKKVSGRLNESVLPSKNLIVKTKTKKSKSAVLAEVSKFFKKKYGLVIESADIESDDVRNAYYTSYDIRSAAHEQNISIYGSEYTYDAIAEFMNEESLPLDKLAIVADNVREYENLIELIDGEGLIDIVNSECCPDYHLSTDDLEFAAANDDLDMDEVEEVVFDYITYNSNNFVFRDGQITVIIDKNYILRNLDAY